MVTGVGKWQQTCYIYTNSGQEGSLWTLGNNFMKCIRYFYSKKEVFILRNLLGSDFWIYSEPNYSGDLLKQLFKLVTTQWPFFLSQGCHDPHRECPSGRGGYFKCSFKLPECALFALYNVASHVIVTPAGLPLCIYFRVNHECAQGIIWILPIVCYFS